MKKIQTLVLIANIALVLFAAIVQAASNADVQKRIDSELAEGSPIVVHVIVALCDNKNQGIVPVPAALGDGQTPKTNLYWGAAFGIRTFFAKRAGYSIVSERNRPSAGVLKKTVFHKQIKRSGMKRDLFVVGEAWDGREMKRAIDQFLSIAAGQAIRREVLEINGKTVTFSSGGSSSLVVFVGHNGLMDFSLESIPQKIENAKPRSSVVLSCVSKDYFLKPLLQGGSHPLLLTTGLMAPESYTLAAVIKSFVRGESPSEIRNAAAAAYHKYQKCGLRGAQRLFWTQN